MATRRILNSEASSHPRSALTTRFSLVIVAVSCFSALLFAKVAAGISGIVTDQSGAVVAGATVDAKNTETGIITSRRTNTEGFYAFVDLPPGHYDIEVRQTGFNAFRQSGIVLDVDSAKVLNIKLNVGEVSE